MKTQSERKSAFSAIALASGFLHEAEKLGLTPELLQHLRESPSHMRKFIQLAKSAKAEHVDRIRRLELERECAVDIEGVHYHLVLITRRYIMDWGCADEGLITDVVKVAERHSFEPLREEAFPTVDKILATVSPGQWIGSVGGGGLVLWERTEQRVECVCSYGDVKGMSLSQFPTLRGMVFMQKHIGCDYNPANQP
jgi:hypothetical protein